MLLSPSWSPAPEKSPVTTSPPPLPPPPPPPPQPPIVAPITSPPSPPTPIVVLPPTSSVPPVISPPSPPVTSTPPVTSPPPPPPTSSVPPVISPPPPPVTSTPPVTSPPLPPLEAPTLPVVAPPPIATTIPPVISPPSHKPLTPPVTSPPLPTTPLVPANSPPSPPLSPPLSPSPLPPTVSPPSRATPLAPLNPPSPPTSSTILPTPTRPDKPPASALVSAPPPLPSSISPPQIPKSLAYPPLPPSPRQSHLPTGLIVTGVIGVVVLLLVLGIVCICSKDRKKRKHSPLEDYYKPPLLGPPKELLDNSSSVRPQLSQQSVPPPGAHVITLLTLTNSSEHSSSINIYSENPIPSQSPGVALGFSSGNFTYDELVVATNSFSDANLLGQGGFGFVHKGVLPNGKQVAVKQLKEKSRQGEREFQAEVETISHVHHKHLVSLVGYCITGTERLLVYEYVPNNTLEYHLHGKGQPVIAWATRLKIAIGCAKGLAYLHEDCNPTIIHRDIKAANILLDDKFEAKVSDFGLAKSFSDTNVNITHISTRVVGTFGYLAPEYATSGKVTDKADVYSYGVVLLQLITGRPPISAAESLIKEGLVDWARPLLTQALKDGNFNALVDPRLEGNYNISEVASMVVCAAACVRHSAWLRPRMSQIVRALEGDVPLKGFSEGMRPGDSAVYATHQYKEDIKIFNLMLRSQQYGINSCSGTTSEYGLNPSSSSSDGSRAIDSKDKGSEPRC